MIYQPVVGLGAAPRLEVCLVRSTRGPHILAGEVDVVERAGEAAVPRCVVRRLQQPTALAVILVTVYLVLMHTKYRAAANIGPGPPDPTNIFKRPSNLCSYGTCPEALMRLSAKVFC